MSGEDLPAAGGQGDEGVAEGVPPHGPLESGALDHGGAHVVLAHLVQQAVLEHHGEEGELGDHVAEHGQDHVVEEVQDLAAQGEALRIRPTRCR